MAGLFAWVADVVGGHGKDEKDDGSIPLVFSDDQRKYVIELDQRAASLSRSIRDLRLRLPPPDISQRLPHLHAHSIASNAALALQLNSHSATREQAQLREETLRKENTEYEQAISNCENKIQEKRQEADSLFRKLEALEIMSKNLKVELDEAEASLHASQSVDDSRENDKDMSDIEASKSAILEELENKRKEQNSMEGTVQELEKKWIVAQEKALERPSPAQREKALDKRLHSLIEQLAGKQAQAEGLLGEIRLKEMELSRLNGLWKNLESTSFEMNTARNRFGRSSADRGYGSDYDSDYQYYPSHDLGARNEKQTRLMYRRSAFVLYILALHVLVFIKISF